MNMAVNIKTLLRLIALLFTALSLVALVGCKGKGSTTAPFGSAVTIKRMTFLHASDPSIPYTNSERWRVSVADSAGNPMNGIDVTLEALIGQGQAVTVNGQTGDAGADLVSTLTTGAGGYKDFDITASDQAIGAILLFPDPVIATALVSSGTLTDGTYTYTVSAKDASTPPRETVAQFTQSVTIISNGTTTPNSVSVSWQAVPGATGYNVYGRTGTGTAGTLGLLASVAAGTTTFTDTGGGVNLAILNPPAGQQPLGTAANVVKGTLSASTGAVTAVGTLDFSNNTP